MDTNFKSVESFNELVFENRNKEYGAYVIRKSYNNNLSAALFSAVLFFGIIATAVFLFTKTNGPIPNIKKLLSLKDSVSVLFDITPPEKLKVEIEKKSLPKDFTPKSDNLNLKASDDKNKELEKTNMEAEINKNGKIDGKDSVPSLITEAAKAPSAPPSNKAEIFVDQMPDFKGNLFQYLRDNLNYPRQAIDNYTSGTVVVQFVVEKDGSIGNIKILNPVGDGCTEEAIRVVKSMPAWKPGKNHGEPVRVLFNLPVKFRIK